MITQRPQQYLNGHKRQAAVSNSPYRSLLFSDESAAGAAYHTCADVPERLAAGSLQLRGDTLLATLREFSAELAARPALPGLLPAAEAEGSAYFDVFARFMVVYPMWLARLLHHARCRPRWRPP